MIFGNVGQSGGLIAGIQASQQGRREDERLDMMQQQLQMVAADRKRANQNYESGEFNKNLYNIERVRQAGGDTAPGIKNMNNFMNKSENFVNEGRFSIGSPETQNEDGTYKNEFLNQYAADTGNDFIPGSTEAADYIDNIKSQMMYTEKGGKPKIFNDNTFAAGSSNYQNYRAEQKVLDRLNEAKITKALGDQGGTSDIDAYATLKENKSRTPKQQTQYEVLQKKLKMSEDANIDKMTGEFGKTLEKVEAGEEIEQGVLDYALNSQAKAKQKYTKRPEMAKSVSGSKRMVETYKDLKNLTSKYDTGDGWSKGVENELLKKTSQEEFDAMDKEEQITVTANAIKQTKVMSKVFEIVAAESGMAFTEGEFERRLSTTVGGDPSKINEQTLMSAFGTFVGEKLKQTDAELGEISDLYMGDKLALRDSFNKGTKGFKAPAPETYASEGKGVSAADTVKGVASLEAEQVAKTAGDVVTGATKGFVDAITGGNDKEVPSKVVPFNIDSRGEKRAEGFQNSMDSLEDAPLAELKVWAGKYYQALNPDEKQEFIKRYVDQGE